MGLYRLLEILEVAEDMAIDIPHIWLYLAELITPMLTKEASLWDRCSGQSQASVEA